MTAPTFDCAAQIDAIKETLTKTALKNKAEKFAPRTGFDPPVNSKLLCCITHTSSNTQQITPKYG
jgi:hypothetical protein